MPWQRLLTKNAILESGRVGSGRIGAGSEEVVAPRPRSGTFLTVADFLAGGGTADVSALGLREKSMSATISLDCVYSSDSKYSWPLNSIAMRSRLMCAGSSGPRV